MKPIFFAILLATIGMTAYAEPHPRQIRFMCGNLEEMQKTMDQYNEKLIIATQAPNEQTVNLLYVNFKTQTSSWFVHDLNTDEYCMLGVGKAIYIPDESPIKQGTGIGTKIIYN